MRYAPRNTALFEKLLALYGDFLADFSGTPIVPVLYGGLSYAYFTGDDSIDIGDFDFIAPESDFAEILAKYASHPTIRAELSDHDSVRVLRDGAKLSIHSEERARPIADTREDTLDVEINGLLFRTVNLEQLLAFYRIGANDPRKPGYVTKYRRLREARYRDHAFFLLKPSVVADAGKLAVAEKSIVEAGFEIVGRRDAALAEDDVSFLYEDSYRKLLPILGAENVERAVAVGKRLYVGKACRFLFVRAPDAVARANALKGATYWPAACAPGTLRHDLRDSVHDGFVIQKGTIADVPCDNVVHTAEDADEVARVWERWESEKL